MKRHRKAGPHWHLRYRAIRTFELIVLFVSGGMVIAVGYGLTAIIVYLR